MKKTAILLLLLLSVFSAKAQVIKFGTLPGEDVSDFLAETKQMNQFFRRFNGEEDLKGQKYLESNPKFRSEEMRKKYLSILFDEQNRNMQLGDKTAFALEALGKNGKPSFLELSSPDWFAEVWTNFKIFGKNQQVKLFCKIEKENGGSKWVIAHAFVPAWSESFFPDTTRRDGIRFIHPLSHELDFMNFNKVFVQTNFVEYFTNKDFYPDHLSILLYEIKNKNAQYESVENTKFHFFQVPGWYFEVQDFNRSGMNRGRLISNLSRLPAGQKDKFMAFIRGAKR